MTYQDKDFLLKDLCARLPYGVKALYHHKKRLETDYKDIIITLKYYVRDYVFMGESKDALNDIEATFLEASEEQIKNGHPNNSFKPYLRPMSSMTEEEVLEFAAFHCLNDKHPIVLLQMCNLSNVINMFDWLNRRHFDYQGLIDKGLAIAVTEENNPYKD